MGKLLLGLTLVTLTWGSKASACNPAYSAAGHFIRTSELNGDLIAFDPQTSVILDATSCGIAQSNTQMLQYTAGSETISLETGSLIYPFISGKGVWAEHRCWAVGATGFTLTAAVCVGVKPDPAVIAVSSSTDSNTGETIAHIDAGPADNDPYPGSVMNYFIYENGNFLGVDSGNNADGTLSIDIPLASGQALPSFSVRRAKNYIGDYSDGIHWGAYSYPDNAPPTVGTVNLPNLNVSKIQVAQAVFLSSIFNKLVTGKPVMGRVSVGYSGTPPDSHDSSLVPIVGEFSGSNGASYRLGACIALNAISPSGTEVQLYPLDGSTGFPFSSSNGLGINFSVQANPIDGLDGHSLETCGSVTQVRKNLGANNSPWASISSQPDAFTIDPVVSPSVHLRMQSMVPHCAAGSMNCDFSSIDDEPNFSDKEVSLFKEIFPIAPPAVDVNHYPFPTFEGAKALSDARQMQKKQAACPPGTSIAPECYWEYVVSDDINRMIAAALKVSATPFANQRYVGIVPRTVGGQRGYFKFLNASLPGSKHADTRGVHPPLSVGVLAEEGYWMDISHELTHSYSIFYPPSGGDFDHAAHVQLAGDVGYWPGQLNGGLYKDTYSYMEARLIESYPPFNHWTEPFTYSKLLQVLSGSKQISRKLINGDQLLLSGVVNKSGLFVPLETSNQAGLGMPTGDSSQNLAFSMLDPSGAVLETSNIPFSFTMIADGDEIPSFEGELAPVLTNLPKPQNLYSLQIRSQSAKSRATEAVTVIFPSLETLKTTLENVPDAAYLGDSIDGYSALNDILTEAGGLLSKGDIDGGAKLLSQQFTTSATKLISSAYIPNSSGEIGLQGLIDSTQSSNQLLMAISQAYPAATNGLIRILFQNQVNSKDGNAHFSVFSLTKPGNSNSEYDLQATVDSAPISFVGPINGNWTLNAGRLSSGPHHIAFQLLIQDKQKALTYKRELLVFQERLRILYLELENEQNSNERWKIQNQINLIDSEISQLRSRLHLVQANVGAPILIDLIL